MNTGSIKHVVFILIGVVTGYIFSYVGAWGGKLEFAPSMSQSEFVKTCGDLNGENYTLDSIKKLSGQCYISSNEGVSLGECNEEILERAKQKIDPWFSVSHKNTLDNTWVCAIEYNESGKIRARPYFFYD